MFTQRLNSFNGFFITYMKTRLPVNCFCPIPESVNLATSSHLAVPVANFLFQKLFSVAFNASLIFYFLFTSISTAQAQTTGDYRSVASGNWSSIAAWERYNGTGWVAAAASPTSTDNVIQIRAGHTVTVIANVTADQILVDASGILSVSTNTLTINNGAGTDMTINGNLEVASTLAFAAGSTMDDNLLATLKSTGTITTAGSNILNVNGRFKREGGTMPTTSIWNINFGGTFEHAMNAGALPLATWKTGSTCEVTGVTNAVPTNMIQTFKSFNWNCASQSTFLDFAANLENIDEDLIVTNTGSAYILLSDAGNSLNVTIGRNLYIQGGITYICKNGSSTIDLTNGDIVVSGGVLNFNQNTATVYGNLSAVVTVNGSVTVSSGTIDLTQSTHSNSTKGNTELYISKNLTVSGTGQITETSLFSYSTIYFNNNSVIQYFSSNTNITNTIHYIVNPLAILSTADNILTGTGTFTLSSTGGLMMGHAAGITNTTMTGNVQCTGTRSYNTGADYTYDGIVGQFTGDGLPATVRNLTLNNSNNCQLINSTTVTGTLTFTTGKWITKKDDVLETPDTLTLGTSASSLGTLTRVSGHVVGNFRRWLAASATSNILFPVGTLNYYNGANFSFTVAPTAGSLVSTFVPTNPGTLNFPLIDTDGTTLYNIGYGYWLFGAMNSYSGGTYNVNLNANGFPGINDYTQLHVVKSTAFGANWTINGLHAPGTGSNTLPVGNRTGMTGSAAGVYGISSGVVNPLPIQLISFHANLENEYVKINWTTATENNNEWFAVERSSNGKDFSLVTKVPGAGTSTQANYYSAIDHKPLYGRSYYRLKQTDFDGRSTVSSMVVINNFTNAEDQISIVLISPVPFSNTMTTIFKINEEDDCLAELISPMGEVMHAEHIHAVKGFNTVTFRDVKNLSPGVYFFRIISETKSQSATRKVVKE